MKVLVGLVVIFGFLGSAQAMIVNTKLVRARAASKKLDNGIFAALDLKQKRIKFTQADGRKCKKLIQRQKNTLKYSCTLGIPNKSSMSILNSKRTPDRVAVRYGNMIKMVKIKVDAAAKSIEFSTEFDNSAIDFDFAEFNSEVFKIFDEAASQVITLAMNQNSVLMTTLEN